MEALVPHEPTGVISPIWHCREQSAVSLLDDVTVLEDHAIAVHVAHATEHIAERVLAGLQCIV